MSLISIPVPCYFSHKGNIFMSCVKNRNILFVYFTLLVIDNSTSRSVRFLAYFNTSLGSRGILFTISSMGNTSQGKQLGSCSFATIRWASQREVSASAAPSGSAGSERQLWFSKLLDTGAKQQHRLLIHRRQDCPRNSLFALFWPLQSRY